MPEKTTEPVRCICGGIADSYTATREMEFQYACRGDLPEILICGARGPWKTSKEKARAAWNKTMGDKWRSPDKPPEINVFGMSERVFIECEWAGIEKKSVEVGAVSDQRECGWIGLTVSLEGVNVKVTGWQPLPEPRK